MDASSRRWQPTSGQWVVVALLFAGVIAGIVSVRHWHSQADKVNPPADTAFNRQAADEAFVRLEQRVHAAIDSRRPEAVREQVQAFVVRYPRYAPGHNLVGELALAEEDYEEAYGHLKDSLQLDARQPQVQFLCGKISRRMGQFKQAEKHYIEAVSLAPADTQGRLHLAECRIEQGSGRLEDARNDLVRLLKANDSLHKAHGLLAEVYLKSNKLNLALIQIDKAISEAGVSAHDDAVKYYLMRARILRRDLRPDEALQTIEVNLEEFERRNYKVVKEIAMCWSAQGRFKKAALVYEAAIRHDPVDPRLPEGAAQMWLRAGEKSMAALNVGRIRRIAPTHPAVAALAAQVE